MAENFIENVSDEVIPKLKFKRMSKYQSGKKKMNILNKENKQHEQRQGAMKQYATGRN